MKFKHSFFAVAALCAVVGLQAQNATDSGTSGSTAPSGTNGSNGMNGTNAMSGPNSATSSANATDSSSGAMGSSSASGATAPSGTNGSNGMNGTNAMSGPNSATNAANAGGVSSGMDSAASGSTAPSGTNGSNGMNGTNAMSGPNSSTSSANATGMSSGSANTTGTTTTGTTTTGAMGTNETTDTSGTTSSTTTTTTTTPYVPPAPAPASMPMAYQTQTMPPTRLEADVSAIYAFRMNTTGVSVDVGGTMNNNFLGFEYTYLNPRGNSYDPVAGRIKENENIDSYEAAYRYSAPLSWFSQPGQWSPVSFYIGGSAGVSYVQLKTIVPRYNFRTSDDDEGVFTAEGNAGVEWAVNRNWGVKVGYRYIYLDRVALYGQRANIDTGALEYGVSFKW
jgi:hypothetical protein